ncbi:AraC family transcriptional regulator [Enterococcus rivorum]|uniref:AraC family transcriptional regulator n=1 Tax=Enterococcus rivorum TaxID=762845 RepID=A0A1E5L1C8_9ENTE|nr:AraC family transcriptional regulator [Enterococcus rivorum]MBP2098747.1 AraC family transcriptional regulator [Enterococcus rivorum]OEH83938.1 AraC family transcriptional regulator [Enterococcus rivorum]
MEWLEQLNKSIDYIEDHLTDDIDISEAAKIAYCSTYHFQRMFSYLAGVPLAEYIRRRRATLAAFDLQQGGKVLDISIKYGYESPTSFTRAFKNIHQIAPRDAKKSGASLTIFPPLKFSITVKGVTCMNYHMVKKDSFRVVGYSVKIDKNMEKNCEIIPKFWDKVSSSGQLENLWLLMGEEIPGVLGVRRDNEVGEWEYLIVVASNAPLQEGMIEYEVSSAQWAVFADRGPMPDAIQNLHKRIFTEWLPISGYEYANAPDIEVYLDSNPKNLAFEVWFPVNEEE